MVLARVPSSRRAALTPSQARSARSGADHEGPDGPVGGGLDRGRRKEGKKERGEKVGRGERTHVMSRHPARLSWHAGVFDLMCACVCVYVAQLDRAGLRTCKWLRRWACKAEA